MTLYVKPYNHWVIPDVAPVEACRAAYESLPPPDSPLWRGNVEPDTEQVIGRRVRPRPWLSVPRLPQPAAILFEHASTFARDRVVNGGVDVGFAGAFVVRPGHGSDMHVDRNNGDRKFTFILFLNEVRRGGELLLMNEAGDLREIVPTPGTLVILPLTAEAWHTVQPVNRNPRYTLAGHLFHEDLTCPVVNSAWWVDAHPPVSLDDVGP